MTSSNTMKTSIAFALMLTLIGCSGPGSQLEKTQSKEAQSTKAQEAKKQQEIAKQQTQKLQRAEVAADIHYLTSQPVATKQFARHKMAQPMIMPMPHPQPVNTEKYQEFDENV